MLISINRFDWRSDIQKQDNQVPEGISYKTFSSASSTSRAIYASAKSPNLLISSEKCSFSIWFPSRSRSVPWENNWSKILFFFFFWLQHAEIPGQGTKPAPQQWQCRILNPLGRQGTPPYFFIVPALGWNLQSTYILHTYSLELHSFFHSCI